MSHESIAAMRLRAERLRELAKELDSEVRRQEKELEQREQEAQVEETSLTVDQARKRLNVSQESIRRYLRDGNLRGFQLPGGTWRVDSESVDEMRQSREPDPGVIDPHASRSRLVAVQGSLRERERVA